MNILVVGSGAREHAIAWKLSTSPRVSELYLMPGNAGTASVGTNLSGSLNDLEGLANTAKARRIDLTIVGPEMPLAQGIVDLFTERGLAIFGPSRAAARIEASKAFGKELMRTHGVPTSEFKIFRAYEEAREFLSHHQGPVVVKSDGLSAGKGALVCQDTEQALKAAYDCMEARAFGASGSTVVVEEYLEGREVSVFAFCDGQNLSPLVAACDYKRLLDGDAGPNTGGMGSYSPPEFWTAALEDRVRAEIMVPTVKAMAEMGTPYRGVLYAGLMITSNGPMVVEFNCRFGDPETQVILPLLRSDLVELCNASTEGLLNKASIQWDEGGCVGVVIASGGYPGEYAKALPVQGLGDLEPDVLVFHAATIFGSGSDQRPVLTDGGRVLTVVSRERTLAEARERVYENIRHIQFQGAHYRRDIALLEAVGAKPPPGISKR